MRASDLIKYLAEYIAKYGDCNVDIITELNCQVEQEVGDVAYSLHEKRIKILPQNF